MSSTQLGRLTQRILTNKAGAGVAYGDVVVIDTANAEAFTTTTTAQYVDTAIGVCIEPNGIANNAQGMIAFAGPVEVINLSGAAAIGDWIHTTTVAGQGVSHGAPSNTGDFAIALEASATPKCLLISGGGGGGASGAWGTVSLLNDSGNTVNAGDLVFIVDYGTASAFTTNSGDPLGDDLFPGIVEDASIANGATGLIRFFGVAPVSNLDASATQGDRIAQSTNLGQATPHTTIGYDTPTFTPGDFGIALDVGTTPPVFLFGLPIQRVEQLLRRAGGINLNTATAQTLFEVPPGRSCVVTAIVIRNVSASLTTVSFSIGFNSASYNNVVADATHTELTGNTLYTKLQPMNGATVGVAADRLKLLNNILNGSATTCTVEVFGYLF